MQRDIADIILNDLARFRDQPLARGLVRFYRDPADQIIQTRAGIAAIVEHAARTIAGAGQVEQRVMRIRSGRSPTQQIEAGIVARRIHLGEEARTSLRVQRDAHIDSRQHGDNGGADRLIIHIAVIRAIQRHAKAIWIACFRQQPARFVQVNARALVIFFTKAVHARAIDQIGWAGLAAHDAALDGRGVYRQLHGTAHAHILEGILALHIGFQKLRAHLIQPQIDGAQFRPLDDAHPR